MYNLLLLRSSIVCNFGTIFYNFDINLKACFFLCLNKIEDYRLLRVTLNEQNHIKKKRLCIC